MKRSVCLGLLAAAMVSASVARADKTCTKIVATGHPDYPVMAFKQGDLIKGAAPLLVAEIADGLEVPFESKYMGTWAEAQSATREGKADMIIGVYYASITMTSAPNISITFSRPSPTIRSRSLSQTKRRSSLRVRTISSARRAWRMKEKASAQPSTPSSRTGSRSSAWTGSPPRSTRSSQAMPTK